jgi:hypothetical protein
MDVMREEQHRIIADQCDQPKYLITYVGIEPSPLIHEDLSRRFGRRGKERRWWLCSGANDEAII